MNWLQQYLFMPNKLIGVECVYRQQQWLFHLVVLIFTKKDQLEIEKTVLSLTSIEEVAKIIEKNPILISINGQGLLHRAASGQSSLQDIFPSAKNEDFYWQIQTWNTVSYWSIIRTTMLQECLQLFQNQGIQILDIHLGAFVIAKAKNLWQNVSEFRTETCTLDWHNSQYSNVANQQFQELTLGKQRLSEQGLCAFATALKFSILPSQIQANIEFVQAQRKDWFYQQSFKKGAIAAIFFFFGLLLTNSYFFFEYQGRYEQLETEWDSKKGLVKLRDTLRSQISKVDALDKIPLDSKTSWYADQIGESLPAAIRLTNLILFPSEKPNPNAEKTWQRFTDNRIEIAGVSTSSIYYQQWKKRLQALPFIQKIEQISYQDIDENTSAFTIFLEINRE